MHAYSLRRHTGKLEVSRWHQLCESFDASAPNPRAWGCVQTLLAPTTAKHLIASLVIVKKFSFDLIAELFADEEIRVRHF